MLIVYVLVQQIESNLIIPLVMSRTVRLHPAVIAIGVVVVGRLFGVVGLFVAVPVISAIVILTEEYLGQGGGGGTRPPLDRGAGVTTTGRGYDRGGTGRETGAVRDAVGVLAVRAPQ